MENSFAPLETKRVEQQRIIKSICKLCQLRRKTIDTFIRATDGNVALDSKLEISRDLLELVITHGKVCVEIGDDVTST